jgi:NTE family protein
LNFGVAALFQPHQLPYLPGAFATDLYTGEEVWLREGPMMRVVRASSGVPGLFTPAWHADRWLIDGGVVNPVPVSMCRAMGADVVNAVDLSRSVTRAGQRAQLAVGTKPATSAVGEHTATEEGSAILKRWSGMLDGLVESSGSKRQEPGLLEAMTSSVNIMQDRITRTRGDRRRPRLRRSVSAATSVHRGTTAPGRVTDPDRANGPLMQKRLQELMRRATGAQGWPARY